MNFVVFLVKSKSRKQKQKPVCAPDWILARFERAFDWIEFNRHLRCILSALKSVTALCVVHR